MKRFSRVSKLISTVLIGGLLGASLVGCSIGEPKSTAVKKTATEIMQEFSAAVIKDNNYKGTCDLALNVASKNSSEKLDAKVNVVVENNKDYQHVVTTSNAGAEGLIDSEEIYIEKTSEGYKSYTLTSVSSVGLFGSKKEFTVEDYDSSDAESFTEIFSGLSDSSNQEDISKYITVKDKTVQHEGRKCYQLDFSASSKDLNDIMDDTQELLPSSLLNTATDMEIKAVIYISTDNKYFDFVLDKNGFDIQKLADSLGGSVSINDFSVRMQIEVGAVSASAVPQDIKDNAVEYDMDSDYELPGSEDIDLRIGETKTFTLPSAYNIKDMNIKDADDGEYFKMEISGDNIKVTGVKAGFGLIEATKKGSSMSSYDFWITIEK